MKNNAPLFLLRLVCPVAGSPGSALESRCPFSRNTGNTMLMPTAARLFRKTHGGWPRPLLKWKNYARRRPLHEINQATAAHVLLSIPSRQKGLTALFQHSPADRRAHCPAANGCKLKESGKGKHYQDSIK